MPKIIIFTALIVFLLTATNSRAGLAPIVLINGASSAPNDAERKAADKTTGRVDKWLEELGVSHSVLNDKELASGKARSAKIIILPYNPNLSEKQLRQLEVLLTGGGKIIVFYGNNPRLAELLGMKVGKYQAASEPGHWSGFQFNDSAPEGMPQKIIQEPGNILTVFPMSEKGKIIAFWHDASGKLLSDPAWVQSEKGAWMTQLLTGWDSENKKRMLLAILGHYEPKVWKKAAQNALRQIERDSNQANAAAVSAAWEKGDYPEVVARADKIRRNNVLVSARNQKPLKNEFRGVWNHSGMGLYPGNWNKTCQLLVNSGITAVFPNMLWAGAAHFPSKYVSQIDKSKPFGDQMAQCVKAARVENLEIHVWKVCWNILTAPDEFKESMRKQGRLQKNNRNETQGWLCPSDPANIALELNTIIEVLNRYDVDGIHLDYIRYPDTVCCYCAGCRERFEKSSGQAIAKWPADVISGKRKAGYKTWRAAQITNFIRTVRREMKKIKPSAKLSAAVYPTYPGCIDSIGQDWGLWLKEGTVDFVCPMDYMPTVSSFRKILDLQFTLQNGNGRIYPGIGATLSDGDLGSEIFISQLRALRERGAGGFMLFDLNPSLAANFLPLIGEGIIPSIRQ